MTQEIPKRDWISVEEEMPPAGWRVLLLTGHGDCICGHYEDEDMGIRADARNEMSDLDMEITHWMPMPEPPHQ